VERLSTVHAEQWSDLEKTKKKRRKRKKQTCGLAVLLVAMDDVAVVDCGADWLVVLLSLRFPYAFYFFCYVLSLVPCFILSPSLVLSNVLWFKIQL
jgi:hypothetical protein